MGELNESEFKEGLERGSENKDAFGFLESFDPLGLRSEGDRASREEGWKTGQAIRATEAKRAEAREQEERDRAYQEYVRNRKDDDGDSYSSSSSSTSSSSSYGPIPGLLALICVFGIIAWLVEETSKLRSSSGTGSGETAFVAASELNVRSAPGRENTILTTLSDGAAVQVLSRTQASDGSPWVNVRAGGVEGWVNAKYLRDSNAVAPSDTVHVPTPDVAASQVTIADPEPVGNPSVSPEPIEPTVPQAPRVLDLHPPSPRSIRSWTIGLRDCTHLGTRDAVLCNIWVRNDGEQRYIQFGDIGSGEQTTRAVNAMGRDYQFESMAIGGKEVRRGENTVRMMEAGEQVDGWVRFPGEAAEILFAIRMYLNDATPGFYYGPGLPFAFEGL